MKNFNNIVPMRFQIGAAVLLTGLAFSEAVLYEDKLNFVLFLLFGAFGLPYFICGASQWYNTVSAVGLNLWCWSGLMGVFGIPIGSVLAVVDAILLWNFRRSGLRIPLFTLASIGSGSNGSNESSNNKEEESSEPADGFKLHSAKGAHPWWRRRRLPWGNSEVTYAYGRIPFFRVSNPFVWYCYSPTYQCLWRDTLLHFLDSEKLRNVYDFDFPRSGGFWLWLTGVANISFIITKVHLDRPKLWKNVDPNWAFYVNLVHAQNGS